MAFHAVHHQRGGIDGIPGKWASFFRRGCPGLISALLLGCAGPQPAPREAYRDLYVRPLSSPGAQFSQLPPTVKHTVLAETGSASVARIDKGTADGKTIYRVAFKDAGLYPPLYVAADGSVLYPNLNEAVGAPRDVFTMATHGPVTRVSLDELPTQVVKAIQHARPDAEVDEITRDVNGSRILYVVTFKGRTHPGLTIEPDGTIVK